jgi:proteasome lid subunit RPN8/RPN11
MPFRLLVPRTIYDGMLAQAQAELPCECCGLLAGVVDESAGVARVSKAYPLINALASPVEFESEPRSMFDAVRDQLRLGLQILAVYHSHPASPPIPSQKDLQRNFSEEVINVIVSLAQPRPEVRAWWLSTLAYQEADFQVIEDPAEQAV